MINIAGTGFAEYNPQAWSLPQRAVMACRGEY